VGLASITSERLWRHHIVKEKVSKAERKTNYKENKRIEIEDDEKENAKTKEGMTFQKECHPLTMSKKSSP
jgi:hypothetical protein